MQEEDFEREIKVLVVGNGGVGKTSMIRRFCKDLFVDEYKKTIGVDFLERMLYVDELKEDVKLMLWDTAGQEEFDSMTRTYYRGAGAAVLCFSTTDRASFEMVGEWKRKVEAECGPIAMALVQNKVDLLEEAVISQKEAETLANTLGLRFYRSCVKKNLNVSEVFAYVAALSVQKKVEALGAGSTKIVPIEGPQTPRSISIGSGKAEADASVRRSSSARSSASGDGIQLQRPARQRTKGKKQLRDKLQTDCSIL